MSTDEYADIRALLRTVEPRHVPAFDADEIMAEGAGARRRHRAERWIAVAAVAVLLVAVGVVVSQAARRGAAPPISPTPSAGVQSVPLTADQWLQFSQVSVNESTSVHAVVTQQGVVFDIENVPGGSQGTITVNGVTSRCVVVGDQAYIEPEVLVALGDRASRAVPAGSWVRLSPQERFATLCSAGANPGNGWRRDPQFGADAVVDGQPVRTVTFDATDMAPGARTMTYFLQAEAPYLPLKVELDGREVGRFSSWNAVTAAPPSPPPAESVVDLPPR